MKTEEDKGIALGEADLGNEKRKEKGMSCEVKKVDPRFKDKRQKTEKEKKIEKKGQGPREKKTIPP